MHQSHRYILGGRDDVIDCAEVHHIRSRATRDPATEHDQAAPPVDAAGRSQPTIAESPGSRAVAISGRPSASHSGS